MDNNRHLGPVIADVEKRNYAYHDETAWPGCIIKSAPPRRDQNAEAKKYTEYEFMITKHTDSSLTVTLKKFRADTVQQRKAKGAAVIYETYQTILSFGELMNRVFGPGCYVYEEEEHFPAEIREAMKQAYK